MQTVSSTSIDALRHVLTLVASTTQKQNSLIMPWKPGARHLGWVQASLAVDHPNATRCSQRYPNHRERFPADHRERKNNSEDGHASRPRLHHFPLLRRQESFDRNSRCSFVKVKTSPLPKRLHVLAQAAYPAPSLRPTSIWTTSVKR